MQKSILGLFGNQQFSRINNGKLGMFVGLRSLTLIIRRSFFQSHGDSVLNPCFVSSGLMRRNFSTRKTIKINDKEEITTSQLLAQLSGNIIQFAKSSEYNQSFNKLLRHATIEELEKVFNEIQSNIYELCTDINGSIVMERIIARSLPHQLDIIFNNLFSDRDDVIKLFSEECSYRVISKIIPKLTSDHVSRLLRLINFNSELIPTLLENENSTNLLTQLIEMYLDSLEHFVNQPMIQLLLNLDNDHINEMRLKQILSKSIEKSSVLIKLDLTRSLLEDITQLDERHSFALSRVYTRLPTNSKEFEEASTLIVRNFYQLAMKRNNKDIVNAFIGFSTKENLNSIIDSFSTNQIEELLKDKNGIIAFSYLFSRVTLKKDILQKLSGKIVELTKNYTSSFFFSSLVEENRELALSIIEEVKPRLLEICSNRNSSFLAIKIAGYPEGRNALLKAFKANIVENYTAFQQVIFHIIDKSSPYERGEILQFCLLSKLNLSETIGDMPEPLFKLILLFIKKGSLSDHTKLVKSFEGHLAKMSTERNTSIILQELYQTSPQVIKDVMNYELLGNIQNIEQVNMESIQSMTTNKHSKHLLNTMIRNDATVKSLFLEPSLKQILLRQKN